MTKLVTKLLRGAVAGAVGTLAMDLLWWRRYRRGGGGEGFADWEFATTVTSFEEASAPGRVGQRVASAIGVDLPDGLAATTTNVVHWLTGAGYGIAHELVHEHGNPVVRGAATGAGAFANSYATLGAVGIYEPIWEYDADVLTRDLTAHLLFGVVVGITAAAFRETGE